MKSLILSFLCFVCSSVFCFSQLISRVDERFELTSIVFRLAEAEEYVNNQVENYVMDIDAYFAPFKEHALIQYVKSIRERNGIAFDAVSGSTFLLEIKNNQLRINPQTDKDDFLSYDPRWDEETLDKYVKLLNKFYKDTKFNTFYNQHQDLYKETGKRFDELLKTIHSEWFQSFFGKPLGNASVYISLCNGDSNYAFDSHKKNDSSDYGIIIGCRKGDEKGIPVFVSSLDENGNPFFDSGTLLTIVHEFSHHFTNPLIAKYEQDMIDAAEKIFPYVEDKLQRVGYGSAQTLLIEGFNALFTNMYFKEYPIWFPNKYFISGDEQKGFVWMRRAIRFMNNFYDDRDILPYIESFMPQLISFINTSGNQIEQIMDEYTHSFPYVVNVFPGLNTIVSSDIKEIRVDFSHPMHGSWGTNKSKQPNLIGPTRDYTKVYWNEDKTTLIFPVKLEQGKNYGFQIAAGICQSSDTFPMKEDYEITFQTEK
jgi:hypothetical protein